MTTVRDLRLQILRAAERAGKGHVPSALSILDLLYVYYTELKEPLDTFILSKGHGCLALYAILELMGEIPPGTMEGTFCDRNSILGGHPDASKVPGARVSSGSLGQGLPQAVGMAMARKLTGDRGKVVCLVGDGELDEGTCWESMRVAATRKLDNLVIVIDNNKSSVLDTASLDTQLIALGFRVYCCDGHAHEQIRLSYRCLWPGHPYAILAKTVKGYGVPEMEADPNAWHHRGPKPGEIDASRVR